ncbi:MAG TPA: GNAT family N-acetyltransferase [Steroidobacteraceae bacterium]|nr:GNAT family N-acetyltransferase [Steroidobacteraceae bacterium]
MPTTSQEWQKDSFVLSTDKTKLQLTVIHGFLTTSYWAPSIPLSVVEKCIANSLCFGLFERDAQIGFARIVSDFATFAYLADVFVLPDWRGRDLSKFMMECIKSHPDLQNLRRWSLATADAHGLYARFGFTSLKRSERAMEITDPEVYSRMREEADSG